MLNQVVIIGRITRDLEKQIEKDTDNKIVCMTLAVPRSFKNENGEYDTDFISVRLYKGVAENTFEYCKKGDLVGVKGRVQNENGAMTIIAEKITFLSSKRTDEE